jgi:ribose transport system permease protein
MTIITGSTALKPERDWTIGWADVGPFIALAALMVIGFAINPDFLSATNLGNVITRSAFIAIIAVGATFVISLAVSISPSGLWQRSSPGSPSCS